MALDIVQGVVYEFDVRGTEKVAQLESNLKSLDDRLEGVGKEAKETAGDIKKTGDAADKAGDDAKNSASKWEVLRGGLNRINWKAVALGAGAAAGGIALVTRRAIDGADAIQKMSIRTGVAAEDLSVLKHAADQGDASLEGIARGMKDFANRLATASTGSKETLVAFNALGINLEEIGRKAPIEQFRELTDRLAAIEDPTLRAALAQRAMGESAVQLLPTMEALAGDGFERVRLEAEELGAVVSTGFANDAARFNDNMAKLKAAGMGAANAFAAELLPVLNAVSEAMTAGVREGTLEAVNPLKLLGNVVKGVASVVLIAAGIIRAQWGAIGASISNVVEAVKKAATGDFSGAFEALRRNASDVMGEIRLEVDKTVAKLDKLWNPEDYQLEAAPRGPGAGGGFMIPGAGGTAEESIDRARALGEQLTRQLRDMQEQSDVARELAAIEDRRLDLLREIEALNVSESTRAALTAQANEIASLERTALKAGEALEGVRESIAARAREITLEMFDAVAPAVGELTEALKDTVSEFTDRILLQSLRDTEHALKSFTRDVFAEIMLGGDGENAFQRFADNVTGILADTLGGWLDGWIERLTNAARGNAVTNAEGEVIGYEGGSTGARVGLAGLQGVAAGYQLYQNGRNGISREDNALAGATSGASIGATFGPVGAVVGALIGGIAGYFTGSDGPAVPQGHVAFQRDGTPFLSIRNADENQIAEIRTQMVSTWRQLSNEWHSIVVDLGAALFEPGSSLNFANHFEQLNDEFQQGFELWLRHELPRYMAETFAGGLEDAFSAAGMNRDRFRELWEDSMLLDPREQVAFWSTVARGIRAYREVQEQMVAAQGFDVFGSSRFRSDGTLAGGGESGFMGQLNVAAGNLVDQARLVVSLTGADQARAFQALADGIGQVTDHLSSFLNSAAGVASRLFGFAGSFEAARLDKLLDQEVDPNLDARLLEGEVNRIFERLTNAASLGLSPEEIEALTNQGLALLDQIYSLDPSAEAAEWWFAQAEQLEAISRAALEAVVDQAKTNAEKLLDTVRPVMDWFLGIPVDLDAVFGMIEEDLFGFGDALRDLIIRIQGFADDDGDGDGAPGGGGPGRGPKPGPGRNNDPNLISTSVSVSINAPVYGVDDLDRQIVSSVSRAIQRMDPQRFEGGF